MEEKPKLCRLIDQFWDLDYLDRQSVLKNWLLEWLDYKGCYGALRALGEALQDPQVFINEKTPETRNYKAIELRKYPREKLTSYRDEIAEACMAMERMFFTMNPVTKEYKDYEPVKYPEKTKKRPKHITKSVEIARKFIPEGYSPERDIEIEKGQMVLM